MQLPHHVQRHTRTQIGHGACRVRGVGQGPLIGALAQQVHLQLRHPLRMRLVAQAEAHRGAIAGPEIVAGLIQLVLHRALELTVDERIEILAHGLVVVGAHDQIGAARARLQARIQGGAGVGAGVEVHRRAVVAGGELHAQLHAQVVGRQPSLVTADDLDIARVGETGAADLTRRGFGRAVRGLLLAEGRVRAHDVRNEDTHVPFGIRAVTHAHAEIAVDRLPLDLTAAERGIRRTIDDLCRSCRTGAATQPVLVDVVVLEVEAQSRNGRVSGRRVGAQSAAAGGAGPGRHRRGG